MRKNQLETISFWEGNYSLRNYPPLKQNALVDVCIIGAGISGLVAGYLLLKEGKTVVILDDGAIAGGQTVRTTAHLTNALDDRYFDLESFFGTEGARMAAESHRAAIDLIESIVFEHKISCEFEHVDAYLFVPPKDSLDVLYKELAATHRVGLTDVVKISRAPIVSFDTGPCLLFPRQAQFHPLKFLDKLCDIIESLGGKIFCGTHATEIEEVEKLKYRVGTDQGFAVHAEHVIVATNSPVNSRFLPHTKQAPYRTYVIAGKVPKGTVTRAIFYDTPDPYHYIRVADADAKHDMLIVGGEDHRTAEKKDVQTCWNKLETWTRKRFPMMQKIDFYWSGQVLEPIDSLAFIGRGKKDANVYMITGDSGNGLTHGTLGAILIKDLILDKKNPWEKLYDPHRKTLKAAREFIEENANTTWQYRDWITPGDVKSEKHLKKGSGVIIRKGLKKCAVYKDNDGNVHECSAVCPHLGAIVRWNSAEHCWECPAHGSRFDAYGKVIQGPANCDLQDNNNQDG